ncbi:MAG: hypothetical protein N2688_04485 [Burkholderiaceae bacterium]|nr:hypothetical protein [Burkholderiaceae bacterium]
MNPEALLKRLHALLPYDALSPQPLAQICLNPPSQPPDHGGSDEEDELTLDDGEPLELLEPPRAVDEPVLLPTRALRLVLGAQGVPPEHAASLARHARALLEAHVPPHRRHPFFPSDSPPLPQPLLTVADWLAWLPHLRQALPEANAPLQRAAGLLDFVAQCAREAASAPLFDPTDATDDAPDAVRTARLVPLAQRPAVPTPQRMITWMAALNDDFELPGDWPAWTRIRLEHDAWMDRYHGELQTLADRLGQSVFLTWMGMDDHEDDEGEAGTPAQAEVLGCFAHRWVALHRHCAGFPDSPLSLALRQAVGADDHDALLKHLLDPALYRDPFDLHDGIARAMDGGSLRPLTYDYRP